MRLTPRQQTRIAELRETHNTTSRATAESLERRLFDPIPVLDHGFVRVIDYMGDDGAIVQAARVSYGHGTRRSRDDEGLIRYLMRNRHSTPFEMCEIKFHIKLPIFVARQWIRHRTANVNEYSARYSVLEDEFYLPRHEAVAAQSTSNAQGRAEPMSTAHADDAIETIRNGAASAWSDYTSLLNEKDGEPVDPDRPGVARELARVTLPVGIYTQWYWKIDLHNLLHFLELRCDSHAQYEIRQYANAIATLVDTWVPIAWQAFSEYRLESRSLSRTAIDVLRTALQGKPIDQPSSALGKTEWRELVALFPELENATTT